jgi:hypothetical protein
LARLLRDDNSLAFRSALGRFVMRHDNRRGLRQIAAPPSVYRGL